MPLLKRVVAGLRTLLRRDSVERELADELQHFLESATEDNMRRGRSPADAARRAHLSLGSSEAVKDYVRDVGWEQRIENLWQDARHAGRGLRRAPAFAGVAILTIALGVGANTAVFGVIYAILLKPLPFESPTELVTVSTFVPQLAAKFPQLPVSVNDFLEYRRSSVLFDALAVLHARDFNLTGRGEPERLHGARVSPVFFSMLGVRPALGRDFFASEETPGQDDVVLISDGLWRRIFAADPSILEATIMLDGRPHTVAGVMPAHLVFPTGRQLDPLVAFGPRVDVWKPAAFTKSELEEEGNYDYALIGRMKNGVSLVHGQQDLARVAEMNAQRLRKQLPDLEFEYHAVVTPLQDVLVGEVRQGLVFLWAAVGVLLLIASVNLANLLLVRLSARTRELVTRAALGAGRRRLMQQVALESLIVTAAGAAAGVAIGAGLGRLLVAYGPRAAATRTWTLETPVLLFALVIAVANALLFTLVPALQATRGTALQWRGAGRVVSDASSGQLRRLLVGTQVALSTMLLVVAGLLLHSFANVMHANAGFAIERVLAADLALPAEPDTDAKTVSFYRQLVDGVASRPGVLAAGAISLLPVAHEGAISSVLLASDSQERLDRPHALRRSVTPQLFSAMDIPLLAGRPFKEQEPQPVAVISQGLARKLWPGDPLDSVIGRGVRHDPAEPVLTVVAVVGDVRADALDRDPPAVIYHHYAAEVRRRMSLVVRTSAAPQALASIVRSEVTRLDPALPIVALRTMQEIVSTSVAPRRFQTLLIAVMATLALTLAVVGVYGVTSYTVSRRKLEIGLRMALGARSDQVLWSVLADGMRPVALGAAVGIAGGLAAARALGSVLFGLGPLDPLAIGGAIGLLLAAAAVACYLPARVAARLDPVAALRAS